MARLPKIRKGCPFCGGTDAFVERETFSSAFVQCNDCSARGPTDMQDGDDEETPGAAAAVRAWNKRTSPRREARLRAAEAAA